jgi:hypothetical protein
LDSSGLVMIITFKKYTIYLPVNTQNQSLQIEIKHNKLGFDKDLP